MKLIFSNEIDAKTFSQKARKAGFKVRKIRNLPIIKTNHPTHFSSNPSESILTWEDVNRLLRWSGLNLKELL